VVYRWQERAQEHSKLLGENISLAGQADNLLSELSNLSSESARLFLVLAQRSEKEDRAALGEPSASDKQFAYREALKEFQPGNVSVVCPRCNSSPWSFTPGPCQLCGNTPSNIESAAQNEQSG
jgi:mobilome CxxCx(11)CxxC protein